jgi:hypothetical protein
MKLFDDNLVYPSDRDGGRYIDLEIYGKNAKRLGVTPAVAMVNPKNPYNVGAALRAASCFGIPQVWFTGDRVKFGLKGAKRLPREERMKGYRDVELRQFDHLC